MANEQVTQTVIASDVQITGTLKSSGSVRMDGKLEGDLVCTGDVTIGRSAVIKGNLQVNTVSIEGAVQGNITAKDKIEMKATAKVHGDIAAKRLSVEDGVTFIGKSEVNPAGAGAPTATRARAAPWRHRRPGSTPPVRAPAGRAR